MATVFLARSLAHTTGVDTRIPVVGRTVAEALTALCDAHPVLTNHLVHPNGKPKGHVLLSVDGAQVYPDDNIGEDDELRVLLATAGGVGC